LITLTIPFGGSIFPQSLPLLHLRVHQSACMIEKQRNKIAKVSLRASFVKIITMSKGTQQLFKGY
jgi:hypothetical protein